MADECRDMFYCSEGLVYCEHVEEGYNALIFDDSVLASVAPARVICRKILNV